MLNRRRKQMHGAFTTYVDDVAGGNHQIKVGGEIQNETGQTLWNQYFTNNVVMFTQNRNLANPAAAAGTAFQVRLGSGVDSWSGLRNYGLFVNDTFTRNKLTLNVGVRWDHYRAFIPEQSRAAGPFFTALTVPENPSVIAFDHFVPRLGLTYDIQGSGKTIFKANYGRYYFNPGVGLADAINPNSGTQYCTYAWNDVNRDYLYQDATERGAAAGCTGGTSTVTVDPNLRNSRTDEFSTWIERQIGSSVGVRAGFVYKMDRDGYQQENPNRPKSAWTVPVTVTDPGPDGRTGTGDDRTGIPAFGLAPSAAALPIVTRVFNPEGYEADYKSIDLSLNKRFSSKWSMLASFINTWSSEFGTSYFSTGSGGNYGASGSLFGGLAGATGLPITPNGKTDKSEFSFWNFKLSGTFEPAWGLRLTPVFKMQQGYPFARVFTANANGGAGNISQNFMAEDLTANRLETVKQVDIRAEKRFKVTNRISFNLLFDVFNVLNANTELNVRGTTGTLTISETNTTIAAFNTPTTILPPRIARISGRLSW
jgi:hypothetical protein